MANTNDMLEVTKKNAMLASKKRDRRTGAPARFSSLGIPPEEMTQSVALAVSALLEKVDDITHELARTRETLTELEQLVDVDCIAPVPNRRAFMRRLAWAISMHERYDHPCSILYFDLNDFKAINDEYGHAAGDTAIRHVSKVLIDSLRGSDFMGRLSGDEFAVLMYYADYKAACVRGKKIAELLAQSSFMWGKKPLFITAACGAYEISKNDNPESALSHADTAMYLDKKHIKDLATELKAKSAG